MVELLAVNWSGILQSIGGILLAILILLAMVTIHEFGHYVAGKILGFKINEFSVGFGPALFKKRSKKTGELFALRAVPLGGYCAFDGEDEGEDGKTVPEKLSKEESKEKTETTGNFEEFETEKVEEKELENKQTDGAGTSEGLEEEYPEPKGIRFNEQAPWKRIIVLVAGATMNYLLALLLVLVMFGGIGQPLYRVEEPRIRDDGTPAYLAPEYEVGDVIEKVNGEYVYLITDYMDALSGKKAGDKVAVGVIRGGERITLEITLQADAVFQNMSDTSALLGSLGIDGLRTVTVRNGFFETIGRSFAYSWKIGGTVLRSLGELLTGKLSLNAMGGPVTTITVTAQAASGGVMQFLNIASLIGVNLAVFNLLPIPALDGSKVVFCLIEWIRKKPINRNVEAMIHFIGIIFLLGFAVLVDLLHLF